MKPEPIGKIDLLSKDIRVSPSTQAEKRGRRKHGFKIAIIERGKREREFLLAADDEREWEEWLNILQLVLRKNKEEREEKKLWEEYQVP